MGETSIHASSPAFRLKVKEKGDKLTEDDLSYPCGSYISRGRNIINITSLVADMSVWMGSGGSFFIVKW